MRARRLLILVTSLLIACLAAGGASANAWEELQKYFEGLDAPIHLDSLDTLDVCKSGTAKLACHLKNVANLSLLVDMAGSGTLMREAATINDLRSGKYKGYGLKTPEHGAFFWLNLTKKSDPKLKRRNYVVMLETWFFGATKIDNEFKDFASLPASKGAFDGTQLGRAIKAQKLGAEALKTTLADIGNYKDLVSDGVYVVDVEFFVAGHGSVYLFDLAGGFGSKESRREKLKNRLQNALAAITKYAQ